MGHMWTTVLEDGAKLIAPLFESLELIEKRSDLD